MTLEQILILVRRIDQTLPAEVDTVCFTAEQLLKLSD